MSKVAPYLQAPINLPSKQKHNVAKQIIPTTELKSNFQQTLENAQ